MDDPNFVPDINLPPLDFDENGELRLPDWDISQRTKLSTQFSPFESSGSGGSPAGAPFINLDIRHSSSQGSLGIASPFGKGTQKPGEDDITMALGNEEVLPFADFGLVIDADGNLVEQPEPELPPYPQHMVEKVGSGLHLPGDEGPIMPVDEELQLIFGDEEQYFPQDAPAQPIVQQDGHGSVHLPSEELPSPEPSIQAPRQRKKRNIKRMAPDAATHVSREEFKGWTANYVARTEEARKAPHHTTTAQAKKNAYNLTFGMGIMGIGVLNRIPGLDHPLAQIFAGDEFKSIVMGDPEEAEESRARRRRSASDAFGEEEEDEERRVRARLEGYPEQERPVGRNDEQGAQVIDDPMIMFGDDLLPEVGREQPGSAMSDHRRSSNAPWNRPSSAVPSSIRSQKGPEGGRHTVEGSPLVGRGSILPTDPKFSDGNMPLFGSDGFGPLPGDGQDLGFSSEFGAHAGAPVQEASTSQFMRDALDREGRNFLGFVENVAADRGEDDEHDEDRRWVEFDGLFEPQDRTRAVVAQAFLHVLTLATKGQIKVKQDAQEKNIPFGEIRVGVTGPFEEQSEDAPEEMEGVEAGEE